MEIDKLIALLRGGQYLNQRERAAIARILEQLKELAK
jgi:hypothetical protein